MARAAIALSIELKEGTDALPGSGLWVRDRIEKGYLYVGRTAKTNRPAVFLCWTEKRNGTTEEKQQLLAEYGPNWKGEPTLDRIPFTDCYPSDRDYMGTTPTSGGMKLLTELARKAQTLLQYRLRQQDRGAKTKDRLKITLH